MRGTAPEQYMQRGFFFNTVITAVYVNTQCVSSLGNP